ncbi:hypothetical protein RSAG8_07123, partial [Rhizoctonia solani AG-8 WAC10335]
MMVYMHFKFASPSFLWLVPAVLVAASPVQPGAASLSDLGMRAQCSATGPYRVCVDYCCKGVGCNGSLNCDRSRVSA